MDGIDLTAIDQIDQDVFNGSPMESDDDETDLPLPDCIGIDSAVQDDEENRLRCEGSSRNLSASRSDKERELELKVLKPDSIRRQILEQSIKSIKPTNEDQTSKMVTVSENLNRSHVMNITEKAGMSGIDKERINQIIHETSKGSMFYKKQAQRQAEIHSSIERMLNRVKSATPIQFEKAKVTCDKILKDLEKARSFDRIIVHFDLDMFFAAVEIRDNPSLKDKPVAVGGDSMVSTSNYIARRFGVRAAMPGFIARRLCPGLVLIKPNGIKYRQASSEVFSILERYDPELASMSLDEAYLDLTEYVKNTLERDNLDHDEYYDGTLPKIWWTRADEIVSEIREAIFEKTKLTCSAGIACNTLLSKISTDINKPNGQFMVYGYPNDVTDFISKTAVEKVSGIGKVSAQFLHALGIQTCGDIYEKREFLPLVFYEINVKFYLRVALGDGSTSVKSDEQRKSKSVERTFVAVRDTLVLLDKLDSICEELCNKYLRPYRIRGRTVTVKLKRNTFTTTTKSYSMLVPTNDKTVIYSAAKNLLLSEISSEPPEISYRLLGVKLSNLADDSVATNQLTIDAMLRNQELMKPTKSENSVFQPRPSSEDTPRQEEHEPTFESVTQEKSIGYLSQSDIDLSSQNEIIPTSNLDGSNPASESQQKRKTPDSQNESLLRKRNKSDGMSNRPDDFTQQSNLFFSQGDDEEFFDRSPKDDYIGPNELSQNEQRQNNPNDEDFQCPYCFKPFSDFNKLEAHTERCYLKLPIDVNKNLYSQRSHAISPSQAVSSFFNRSSGSKSKALGSQLKQTSGKKMKAKTQKTMPSQPSSSPGPSQMMSPESKAIEHKAKLSFYQKFIESNSQCLTQSSKAEPLQCPHCHHGFLNFSSLQTHVMMCFKQKKS